MQKQPGTRALIEGALLAALTVVIAVSVRFIPLAGLLVSIFWPLPVAVAYLRHGLKVGVLALAVAVILSTAILGPLDGFGVLANVGAMGLAIGYTYRHRLGSGAAFLVVSGASAVTFVVTFLSLYFFTRVNLLTEIINALETSNAMARDMMVRIGASTEQITMLETSARDAVALLRITLPALALASVVFLAFVNLLAARWVLGRLGYQSPAWLPFAEWRLPPQALWVALPAFALIFLVSRSGSPTLGNIGMNLFLLLMTGFRVLGISVAYFFLSRSRIPKALTIFILVYANIIPLFGLIFSYLGLWDLALNLRRLGVTPRA